MRVPLFALVTAAVLAGAGAASAQTPPESRPERPYLGVYGGGTQESAQVLSVSGSVGTGYDTNARLGANDAGFGVFDQSVGSEGSYYNQFSGGLSYSANLPKLSFGASLSSSARQYPRLDTPITASHGASAGTSVSLGSRTSLTGGVSATYHSMRNFTPFPDLAPLEPGRIDAPSLDFGFGRARYYTYATNAGATHQLSRRSSLTLGYSRQDSSFSSDLENLSSQSGTFRYSRSLTRYLGLRIGYGYTDARYGIAGRRYQTHNIDSGVDYSRDLSLTRRTSFSFSTGATALQQEQDTRFDAIGSATLTREVGRTWKASLAYRRNVGYAESVLEPIFSDGINVGYGGLITRRLSFQSGAGASRGTVGLNRNANNGFDAIIAFAGVSRALTRHLALNVNYSFYRYSFEPGAAVVTGLTPGLNRHSVNVTVSAWAPVFQHGRKKNASR
jgi:hypothetical protein